MGDSGVEQGDKVLLDGRDVAVKGFEQGNFVGPTIVSGVTSDMTLYQNEVFGPVLQCMEVDTMDKAISTVNANPYGNGVALFTKSGSAARKFQHEIDCGQVGIN